LSANQWLANCPFIREAIRKRCIPTSAAAVEVLPAQLGESAGVVGASLLVNQK